MFLIHFYVEPYIRNRTSTNKKGIKKKERTGMDCAIKLLEVINNEHRLITEYNKLEADAII